MKSTLLFCLSFSLLFAVSASAALVSTTVGQVQDDIVTSREVGIHFFVENALFSKPAALKDLTLPAIESRAFSQQVNNLLLEKVVYIESQNFTSAKISSNETNEAIKTVESRLKGKAQFHQIEASPNELRNAVQQMLQAKKFIQFKSESSAVPVTDNEAIRYYEENKKRFGTLPFENFKENIKAFLTRSQSDKRLKEWLEVLQSKYRVRNFQAEI